MNSRITGPRQKLAADFARAAGEAGKKKWKLEGRREQYPPGQMPCSKRIRRGSIQPRTTNLPAQRGQGRPLPLEPVARRDEERFRLSASNERFEQSAPPEEGATVRMATYRQFPPMRRSRGSCFHTRRLRRS